MVNFIHLIVTIGSYARRRMEKRMKSIRKILVLLLAVLTLVSAACPAALAEELENEDELIEAALSETEEITPEGEPEAAEESESREVSEQEEKSEPEETSESEADSEEDEPEEASEPSFVWQTPGASDLDILAGGTMLSDGDAFYYADGGIWCDAEGQTRRVSSDNGANLNLVDGWLYYTTWADVRRVSLVDGTQETVYECPDIAQLYVIGRQLLYLADGAVYLYDMTSTALTQLDAPENTAGLIPTEYGNLYLTGEAFDRSVWVDGSVAFEGVMSCYTDTGYLVVERSDGSSQISLEALFAGERTLATYSLHQGEKTVTQLSEAEALAAETAYFDSEEYAALEALATQEDSAENGLLSLDGAGVLTTAQQLALSNGNTNAYNITRRARQQTEVLWTPLKDRYGWGATIYRPDRTVTSLDGVTTNYFVAGETYQGVPYAWPIWTSDHPEETYVGWQVSVSQFVSYVNNSSSKFYSGHSGYYTSVYAHKYAPYYGSDCAAFVASAWNLPYRCTCSSLVNYSTYIGNNINQIRLGDCLNKTTEHVVLVTDIGYDIDGNIVAIEITEQTPLIMKVTNYGEKIPGKTNKKINYVSDLMVVQRYYLNGGYDIYRRSYSGSVSYTAESAIPLTEDGWLSVPTLSVSTNSDGSAVLVTLAHKSASVRYTTDGSAVTRSSPLYTTPISLTEDTIIRAAADYSGSSATGSFELYYEVEVEHSAKPALSCVSGGLNGTTVEKDSFITLVSDDDAVIYYTTDGKEPTTSSAVMSASGIKITAPLTLRAIAVTPGKLRSEAVSYDITLGSFYDITVEAPKHGSITPSGTVTVLQGANQTFTMKADEDYKVGDVLVDGKSVGAVTSYTLKAVDKAHTLSVKFVVDLPFTDVKTTAWYADQVAYVYTNGLFTGTSSTAFSPQSNMTRGQFATVLGRLAGMKGTLEGFKTGTIAYTNGTSINIRQSATTSSTAVGNIASSGSFVTVLGSTKDSSGNLWYKVRYGSVTGYIKALYNGKSLLKMYTGGFKDISGQYYNGYVQWAYYKGLVNGMSSTSFGSTGYISRQDICVILYNYLTSYCGKSLSKGGKTFTDEASIASYANTAVHALANIGVVNGYENGSFAPRGYATRAEVATMLTNLSGYLNG